MLEVWHEGFFAPCKQTGRETIPACLLSLSEVKPISKALFASWRVKGATARA
jgi:hypothetical protein